jgi:CDP-glucose 4,6-dehydratase
VSAGEELSAGPRGRVDPAFWRGRRVFLTGHTGFKGAWLALWLQSLGAQLTGFSLDPPSTPSLHELARVDEEMRGICGDVRDRTALAAALARTEPEVVIHMAAQPLVRRSLAEPHETYETNVMGTLNVLDAVRIHPAHARVVINVTSDKCYEDRESERGYRECDRLGGRDPYASSKACAELLTAAFRQSYFSSPDGPRVATARAGNAIGGGDWAQDRLLPDIMRAALAGEELRLRNPTATRPWQHVLNPLSGYLVLAQALWSSAEHACGWNFGPGEEDTRSVEWVVERTAELWPGELRWAPERAAQPVETARLKLDSSRARERLGWRPLMQLDEALRSTVDWCVALEEGADMRAVTLAQIAAAERPALEPSAEPRRRE